MDAEVARSNRADPIQMTNTLIVYTNLGFLGPILGVNLDAFSQECQILKISKLGG